MQSHQAHLLLRLRCLCIQCGVGGAIVDLAGGAQQGGRGGEEDLQDGGLGAKGCGKVLDCSLLGRRHLRSERSQAWGGALANLGRGHMLVLGMLQPLRPHSKSQIISSLPGAWSPPFVWQW